jgi:acyl transferase domain-containing protein
MKTNKKTTTTGLEIAVVGMAGRFANADNIDQYWQNLKNGVESVAFLTEAEMDSAGISKEMRDNPHFVPCKGGVVHNREYFDAVFFKYLPNEAELLSPQTRIFHECVWEALENAGYGGEDNKGTFGIYAGASSNFLWEALVELSAGESGIGKLQSSILSANEFLCSQTSYKLNLTGPSVYVQTACSTSLVAINHACRALLTGECRVALAGGVSMGLIESGYMYEEGMISSKDGHVRTFDSAATGAVNGEGVGVVVLKLLKNALKDGDQIHAVIKGAYSNNDGDEKVGFTAPGVNGQAKVIASSLRMAGVEPESISYIEAHGTATALGDVTEMEALKLAFNTKKQQYCAIGSVKTNMGHLDAAAGVAGFIKTVLSLKHKQIPPSLHYQNPNPQIDFVNSPFYVNTTLCDWTNEEYPLRAGVSSFGIGGTNAHVILEEAPEREAAAPGREDQLLLLSAKTPAALDQMTVNLANWLKENTTANLADIAYTLQVGRKGFPFRRKISCTNIEEAIAILSDKDSRKIQTHKVSGEKKQVVFMFSGLGAQYTNMCRDLYDTEPLFQQEMDACFALLKKITGRDIQPILYPGTADTAPSNQVHDIDLGQYLVFVIEYALAKLLMAWGIKPYAIIGYSFGEYVAACISGVFSVEDALNIIHKRGELIKALPAGVMLSVPLTKTEVAPLLNGQLSLAIDNGTSCIVSGPEAAIAAVETTMKTRRLMSMRLEATRAVHSQMMEPAMQELEDYIRTILLQKPVIPYISNVTGDWIQEADATDPAYWTKHLRHTVQFFSGVKKLLEKDRLVYMEIGPGSDISVLVNRELELAGVKEMAINIVKPGSSTVKDTKYLVNKLGQLWLYGVPVDWSAYHKPAQRYRVSLPGYPFERAKYWKLVEHYQSGNFTLLSPQKAKTNNWLYLPTWKRAGLADAGTHILDNTGTILIFMDEQGVGAAMAKIFAQQNATVITVEAGKAYAKTNPHHFTIDPASYSDYEQLFADLKQQQQLPARILHLFSITQGQPESLTTERINQAQEYGYYSLINIVQTLGIYNDGEQLQIDVVANGLLEVTGAETIFPDKSTLLGPVKVIPQENGLYQCRYMDIELPTDEVAKERLARLVVNTWAKAMPDNTIMALRGDYTWLPDYEPAPPVPVAEGLPHIREKGVYLITGGLGGIALALSVWLAKEAKARLVLVGRSAFPAKENWKEWLATNNDTNSTSEKIRLLQQVEALGGEVMIGQADMADKTAMQQIITAAQEKWGAINGVIHSATIPDGAMIAVREKKMSEELFSAKLHGTLVVDELLQGTPLDVVFFFSTLSSILGGFGQVGYCAGNIFLDTFARYKARRDHVFAVSINWDRWRGIGISKIAEEMHERLLHEKLAGGMELPQALHCFRQVLALDNISQVAVAETDLRPAIVQSKQPQGISMAEDVVENGMQEAGGLKASRPELSAEYAAPATEMEKKLVNMWEQFFGMEPIGIHDNFFELGGDSLKSMVLLKRMKKDFDFEAGIKLFFLKPTISQIAAEMDDIKLLLQKKERTSKITI